MSLRIYDTYREHPSTISPHRHMPDLLTICIRCIMIYIDCRTHFYVILVRFYTVLAPFLTHPTFYNFPFCCAFSTLSLWGGGPLQYIYIMNNHNSNHRDARFNDSRMVSGRPPVFMEALNLAPVHILFICLSGRASQSSPFRHFANFISCYEIRDSG